MDRATQLELNAINRRFYAAIAPEWSDKRKRPWPGWARVLSRLRELRPAAESGTLRVLDLGCGDGRLAAYLSDHVPQLDYLGVDVSAPLLERARARAPQQRFLEADFLSTPLAALSGAGAHDLVCVFGVLHHVPGYAQRLQLLRELAALLDARALLALTVWRLDEDARFASRRVRFEDYNRSAAQPIALDQLEPGDTLLRWGSGDAPPRYCHFPDRSELDALIGASELRELERFRADGHGDRMNEYVLLTTPHT